jgi:colanic acid biosynthesis glycosyl transferase WcaI
MSYLLCMKVLLFNIYFNPDSTGTGQLVTELAHDLVALGLQVTIITSILHYGLEAVSPRHHRKLFWREQFAGADVWRTYVYVPRRPSFSGRLLNYLSYNILSAVAGCCVAKHDVVLAVLPPVTTAVSAWLVSHLRRIPLVVSVQDLYPETVFSSRLTARLNHALEQLACRGADSMVCISQAMQRGLRDRGVPPTKLSVIPNWADISEIRPLSKANAFWREHGLESQFVVLYSGNMGVLSGVKVAVEAAALLRERRDIVFLLVGHGHARGWLKERAAELKLPNLRFLPLQPRERLAEMLAAADLALVTMDVRLSITSVPHKVYTIMAAGRPILAAIHPDNEVAHIVRDVDCGICVPPDAPERMAEAIVHASAAPSRLERQGRNGREYVVAYHARSRLTLRYHELLSRAGRPKAAEPR